MIETRLLNAQQPDAVSLAANWLRQGYLVAFPTDTVYGVGADAFNAAALERLYQAKQRPLAKGIPILLADVKNLDRVVTQIPAFARHLIEQFWPGPLTLILPRHPDLPALISPNNGVAVRLPDNETARALIRAAGGAVAATSANRSGHPPALNGDEAGVALMGLVSAVLDDGASPGGIPSTIVDCTGEIPRILRIGPLSAADISLTGAPA
jgi:L-threonylcarbamoyladenylate synthase